MGEHAAHIVRPNSAGGILITICQLLKDLLQASTGLCTSTVLHCCHH